MPDRPERVALVYDHVYPWSVGGAERWYWALGRALSAGRPVSRLGPRAWDGERRREHDGTELVGVCRGAGPARKLRFAFGLWRHLLVHGGRYAVVHCACFPSAALVAARLGLLPHRRTRLVGDWHEVLPRSDWRRRRGRTGDLAFLVQRIALRAGDGLVAFSRLHAGRLRSVAGGRVVRVIPEFVPEEPAVRAEPQRERLVVFVGRLVAEKRPELAVEVVDELRREAGEDWRGLVFGRGPEEKPLRGLIADRGLGDAVRLAGFVPWEELSDAYARASALVLPSFREGFGLAVLEAAAHGLPSVLVAGEDNAAVELIEPGVNGSVCGAPEPAELAAAVRSLTDAHDSTLEWYERASARHSAPAAVSELEALWAELRPTR